MKLQPDGVVAELAARQSGPFDRVLAFLDVVPRFAPLIVNPCHPLSGTGQVGDDEADAGTGAVNRVKIDRAHAATTAFHVVVWAGYTFTVTSNSKLPQCHLPLLCPNELAELQGLTTRKVAR